MEIFNSLKKSFNLRALSFLLLRSLCVSVLLLSRCGRMFIVMRHYDREEDESDGEDCSQRSPQPTTKLCPYVALVSSLGPVLEALEAFVAEG